MANSRKRLSLALCCVAVVLATGAVPARAASLHIADAEATVAQGESASFAIHLSASGALTCRAAAVVAVDSTYSVATDGTVATSDPADVTFSASDSHGSGHNCEPTWDGAPSPYELTATAAAASDTPLGDYTAPIHYEVQNAPGTGPAGKLSNAGSVNVTIHVVAPGLEPTVEQTPSEQIVLGERIVAGPKFGKTVMLTPVSGSTRYRTPHGNATVLTVPVLVPNGTLVDATSGHVEVTVERRPGGAVNGELDSAEAWGGAFVVSQNTRGITRLRLGDPLAVKGAHAARVNLRTRANKKKKRLLWVNGKGNFQTQGKRASAILRGTVWLTEDVGQATRVTVKKGAVAVRDFVTKRTVLVTAGHSYTARPRAVIRKRVPAFTGRAR